MVDREEKACGFHTTGPVDAKMVNVREQCTTRSTSNNADTTPIAKDPERVSRNGTNPLYRAVYINLRLTRLNVQGDAKTLARALEPGDGRSPSVLDQRHDPTPTPKKPVFKLLAYVNLLTTM